MPTNGLKKYTDLRIVFMGTPEFAVASLDALVKAGCNICVDYLDEPIVTSLSIDEILRKLEINQE